MATPQQKYYLKNKEKVKERVLFKRQLNNKLMKPDINTLIINRNTHYNIESPQIELLLTHKKKLDKLNIEFEEKLIDYFKYRDIRKTLTINEKYIIISIDNEPIFFVIDDNPKNDVLITVYETVMTLNEENRIISITDFNEPVEQFIKFNEDLKHIIPFNDNKVYYKKKQIEQIEQIETDRNR